MRHAKVIMTLFWSNLEAFAFAFLVWMMQDSLLLDSNMGRSSSLLASLLSFSLRTLALWLLLLPFCPLLKRHCCCWHHLYFPWSYLLYFLEDLLSHWCEETRKWQRGNFFRWILCQAGIPLKLIIAQWKGAICQWCQQFEQGRGLGWGGGAVIGNFDIGEYLWENMPTSIWYAKYLGKISRHWCIHVRTNQARNPIQSSYSIRMTIRIHRKRADTIRVPRKLSYVECHIRIVQKYQKLTIFTLLVTPFLHMYVNRMENVEPLHLLRPCNEWKEKWTQWMCKSPPLP